MYNILFIVMKGPFQQQAFVSQIIYEGDGRIEAGQIDKLPLAAQINSMEKAIHQVTHEELRQQIGRISSALAIISNTINEDSNNSELLRFLNLITYVISQIDVKDQKNHLDDIVNVFISKTTGISITSSMTSQQKSAQLSKWRLSWKNNIVQELCVTISSFIIENADLTHFDSAILLVHFMLQSHFKINDTVILSFCWLIRKKMAQNSTNSELAKDLALLVTATLMNYFPIRGSFMKLYANCLLFYLKNAETEEEIDSILLHFGPFGFASSSFVCPNQPYEHEIYRNRKQLTQQKQQLFSRLCYFYIYFGREDLLSFIKNMLRANTSTSMVKAVWNLLNVDNNELLHSKQCIQRLSTLLKWLQQYNKITTKQCFMNIKGSFIAKTIDKKNSLMFIRMQICHPHQKIGNSDQVVLRIQLDRGMATLFVRDIQKEKGKNTFRRQFYVKMLLRQSVQNKSAVSDQYISLADVNQQDSIFCSLIFEFKVDSKIRICLQNGKLLCEINHGIFGRPKGILIGVRQSEKQIENAIKKVQSYFIISDISFNQFIQEKNKVFNLTTNSTTIEKKDSPSKRKKSDKIQKLYEKFDLFQHLETFSNEKSKQSFKERFKNAIGSEKSFNAENIQIKVKRNYQQIVKVFQGKQKLISYLFSSIQTICGKQQFLSYLNLLKRQFNIFSLNDQDYYQLLLVSGYCNCVQKSNIAQNLIPQFMVPSFRLRGQQLKKISKRKLIHMSQNILRKLDILLSLLQSTKDKLIEDNVMATFQEYMQLMVNLEHKEAINCSKKMFFALKQSLFGCINDFSTQNESAQCQENLHNNTSNKTEIIQHYMDVVKKVLIKLLENHSTITLTVQFLMFELLFFLIILSNSTLRHTEYIHQITILTLQGCQQILIKMSGRLNELKSIPQNDQIKICNLLSQIYNMLPILNQFCKVKLRQNAQLNQFTFQQYFYDLYCSSTKNFQFKSDKAYRLMEKCYQICIQIGLYTLKQRKQGYATYLHYAIHFMNQHKDEYSWDKNTQKLTYNDRIMINQIYINCWRLLVGCPKTKQKKLFSFDDETKKCIKSKLIELCFPIYYFQTGTEKSLIQNIIHDYLLYNRLQKFPSCIIQNIQPQDLSNILKDVKQKINVWTHRDSNYVAMMRIYLLKIANDFPKSLQLGLEDEIGWQTDVKQIAWPQFYLWCRIYNKMKKLNDFFSNQHDDNRNSLQKKNIKPSTYLFTELQNILNVLDDSQPYKQLKVLINSALQDRFKLDRDGQNQQIGMLSFHYYESFIQMLMTQCKQINDNKILSGDIKKRKPSEYIASPSLPDPNTFFMTEKNRIKEESQPIEQDNKLTKISSEVAKRFLWKNSHWFLSMHENLVRKKTMTLKSYYKIIENLSLQQKINRQGKSIKYKQYDYYILDDCQNKQNMKVLLKRDTTSITNNCLVRQIPRLFECKQTLHNAYVLNITKNLQNLYKMPYLQELIQKQHKSAQLGKQKKNTNILSFLVTKSKIYQGFIEIQNQYISYRENTTILEAIYNKFYACVSEKRTLQQIAISRKELQIQIKSISYIQPKKYLQTFPAIQIYTQNLSYFFVFQKEQNRSKFVKESQIYYRRKQQYQQLVKEVQLLYQQGWINNFQTIQNLNNISGRSLNDVSQYYIFPWTVINFKDDMNPEFWTREQNFRNLSKPIGSLNKDKMDMILSKYQNSKNQLMFNQPPFMFGSFYSNPGMVCNFLLRVNPFTVHHYQLQGNKFDLFDRLFINMDDQFASIYNTPIDNRELLPEFYCAPQFFRNRNLYNFSHKPEKTKIDLQMRFPSWVLTQSPQQFVLKMRRVLQSSTVKQKLGKWIDIIFGFKSDYENAAKYNNLYMSQLYRMNDVIKRTQSQERQMNLSQLEVKAHMIKQFGQVPKNIFGKSQALKPSRISINQSIREKQLERLKKCEHPMKQQDHSIILDFCQCKLVMSSKNILIFTNTVQDDVFGITEQIQEELQSLSIMSINKTKFTLIFTVSISGKLLLYVIKRDLKRSYFLSTQQQYKIVNRMELFSGATLSHVKTLNNSVIAIEDGALRVFEISVNMKQTSDTDVFNKEIFLQDRGYLFLHHSNIINIQTDSSLGVAVTIDQNSLVSVFSLQPQFTLRAIFKIKYLKASQIISKVLIQSMGILVLLTNHQQILVYNIYGDLIERVKIQIKGISDITLWDSSSSLQVLISSRLGSLYQVDLFDLVRPGQECSAGVAVRVDTTDKFLQINKRQSNKIVMFRIGCRWSVYVISSLHQIYVVKDDKGFNKDYYSKRILKNCNENTKHKNV